MEKNLFKLEKGSVIEENGKKGIVINTGYFQKQNYFTYTIVWENFDISVRNYIVEIEESPVEFKFYDCGCYTYDLLGIVQKLK